MSALVIYEDMHPIWETKPSRQIFGTPDPETGHYAYVPSGKVDYWVDIMIDAMPLRSRFPWRRWLCEVHGRRSIWPPSKHEGETENIWTHYYTHDFYASSLRQAFLKADDVGLKLAETMQADPSERPDVQN